MNWANWEKKHQADTKLYLQQVAAVYRSAVKEAAAIGATIIQFDPSRPFSFSDYPQTKARIDKLASSLAGQIDTVVLNGIDAQWTLANNKNSVLCDRVFGDYKDKLTATQQRKYYTTNAPAREAFKAHATNGLGLSDRVWKYTDQFKTEIELGLDLGLRDGLSAAEMSRDLRQYLQQPDKLFRRVRDEHGALRLSEAAKAYNPGRGVYRSSYKNALRLTSTETNIAYRTADFERWQGFDFVIGIEVKKSNNHPVHDMCDMLAGRYPKGFKFTGWHPNCRCYAVPILQEIDDFLEDKPATGQIESTPSNYNDWVGQNKDRFTSQRNTPYFMRDNKAFVQADQTTNYEQLLLKRFKLTKEQLTPREDYWTYAKEMGLTPIEAYSIRQYTINEYGDLNYKLRNGIELSEYQQALRDAMNSGIEKLEVYDRVCFRGSSLTDEDMLRYTQALRYRVPIVEKGYTSTSLRLDTTIDFMDNVFFEIKSKKGRYLDFISNSMDEHEILFKEGSKFRIIEIKACKISDLLIITKIAMEEV